jgi:hypothetical protein
MSIKSPCAILKIKISKIEYRLFNRGIETSQNVYPFLINNNSSKRLIGQLFTYHSTSLSDILLRKSGMSKCFSTPGTT